MLRARSSARAKQGRRTYASASRRASRPFSRRARSAWSAPGLSRTIAPGSTPASPWPGPAIRRRLQNSKSTSIRSARPFTRRIRMPLAWARTAAKTAASSSWAPAALARPSSKASATASAAGASRCRTRAAARGSAASLRGACCGRMTAASHGRSCSAGLLRGLRRIRTQSCAGWVQRGRADFAALAPLVAEHATADDLAACELMSLAAEHIGILVRRLVALGAPRVALAGGLASKIEPWLNERARQVLVPPAADALTGAVDLAKAAAASEATP